METYQAAAEAFTALGDGTRREIFELLRDGPMAVGDLAASLPVTRPAVSQHLRVLKGAGLVDDERAGNRRLYRVDPATLDAMRAYLDDYWGHVLGEFKTAIEAERGDRK